MQALAGLHTHFTPLSLVKHLSCQEKQRERKNLYFLSSDPPYPSHLAVTNWHNPANQRQCPGHVITLSQSEARTRLQTYIIRSVTVLPLLQKVFHGLIIQNYAIIDPETWGRRILTRQKQTSGLMTNQRPVSRSRDHSHYAVRERPGLMWEMKMPPRFMRSDPLFYVLDSGIVLSSEQCWTSDWSGVITWPGSWPLIGRAVLECKWTRANAFSHACWISR